MLSRTKSHYLWVEWRLHMAPFYILDMLIAANLGDTPQVEITRKQFEEAIKGRKWTTC